MFPNNPELISTYTGYLGVFIIGRKNNLIMFNLVLCAVLMDLGKTVSVAALMGTMNYYEKIFFVI